MAAQPAMIARIAAQTAVAVNSLMTFQKLEESEARFREAFAHAATGIALADPDGRIRVSNRYLQFIFHIRDLTAEEDFSGRERVLFVDDESMLVHLGRTILTKQGYRVTGMTDPREALDHGRPSSHR